MGREAQLLMMPSVSIAIMAVREREAQVNRILSRLGGGAAVLWDDDRKGVWWNAQRAWGVGIDSGADYHVVLQDDVEVCQNFKPGAQAALSHIPENHPACFFANRRAVLKAKAQGLSWALIADGSWGQASCLPTRLINDFLGWSKRSVREEFKHDDTRLAMYGLAKGLPFYCTAPSLVEHVGHNSSLIGHKTPRPRVATWYIGDGNPLKVDWSAGVDNPPFDPGVNHFSRYAKYLL